MWKRYAVLDQISAGQIVNKYYALLEKGGKYYALRVFVDRSLPVDKNAVYELRLVPERGKGHDWTPDQGAPPWKTGWRVIDESSLDDYVFVS